MCHYNMCPGDFLKTFDKEKKPKNENNRVFHRFLILAQNLIETEIWHEFQTIRRQSLEVLESCEKKKNDRKDFHQRVD